MAMPSKSIIFATLSALALAIPSYSQVVISQVYGGGQGTGTGTPYANDFVELFNAGTTDVALTGYAIQYQASGTTGNWSGKVSLSGTILAKHYFLVQMSGTGTVGAALPTPDVVSTAVSMSATGAKVALTSNTTTLVTAAGPPVACPSGGAVVDLVGYGSSNCGEGGTTAPAPTALTAVFRASGGCTDTNSNSADFPTPVATPTPRNSGSPVNNCGAPATLSGAGAGSPNPVSAGNASLITVTVTPGASPASTGIAVTANLSAIGGSPTQSLFDNGTNGDLTAGDNIFSFSATVPSNATAGPKAIAFSISDTQSRTANGSFNLTVTVPAPVVSINQIQGSGATSPYAGQTVQTSGIVTLRKSNGFYLQTPDAQVDSDPNTSEGVFVFTSSAPPSSATVGNSVQVQGTVTEFTSTSQGTQDPNSTTELTSPTVTLLSTGNPLPTPIVLSGTSINQALGFGQLEKYEGMRVSFSSLTATGPTGGTVNEVNATSTSNGRFYAVPTGVAKPFREPGIQIGDPLPLPGIPRWDGNLEIYEMDFNMPGDTPLDVTSNAVITGVIGVLDYFSPYYVINHDPATTATVTGLMTAVPVTGAATGQTAIAAFNIERFYDTVDDPNTSDVILTSTALFNRLKKVSLAVRNVLKFPDIISFEECENLTTLQAIASQINTDAQAASQPVPNYAAYLFSGNDIGGINVGFLIKSNVTVNSVTQLGLNDTYTDPGTGLQAILFDRPPLVADVTAGSVNLKVISVHLRSLNGVDTQDASGNRVRAKRAAGAEKLAQYIQSYQAANGANVVVLGDFNAFEFNDGYVDVMNTIKGTPTAAVNVEVASPDFVTPDLIDLMETRLTAGVNRYSYNFTGSAQVLDHIVVNTGANALVNRVEVARNDADFPESFRNDSTRPERISDHDMPMVYLNTASLPVVTTNPVSQTVAALQSVTFTAAASGGSPTVQWQVSSNGGATFNNVSGAQSTTLTFIADGSLNGNQYRAVFTNSAGPVNSSAATLTVTKLTPSITWANPADILFGSALGAGQLNATATVAGTFAYIPALGTVLPVGNGQPLSVAFTPTDAVNYTTASKSVLINVTPSTIGPANVTATTTLARDPESKEIVATITVSNSGGTAASNVGLTSAILASVPATSVVPAVLGSISASGQAVVRVRFPGSVGAAGTRVVLNTAGSFDGGGTFGGSTRIVLP